MSQADLFDTPSKSPLTRYMQGAPPVRSVEATQKALGAMDRHVSEEWRQAALTALRLVAWRLDEFTTDDVQGQMRRAAPPGDPRAWGIVMQEAARRGWITRTERVRASQQTANHGRHKQVWLSRIVQHDA